MKIGIAFLLVSGVLSVLEPAWSQEVTAGIVGTVVDPSEAPIKDATVTATDTERGTVRTVITNDAGAYNLTRVPVGTYDLRISATGFQTALHSAITLVLNQTARVDMQMKMGQVTETVEVSGSAPVLQTRSEEHTSELQSPCNLVCRLLLEKKKKKKNKIYSRYKTKQKYKKK